MFTKYVTKQSEKLQIYGHVKQFLAAWVCGLQARLLYWYAAYSTKACTRGTGKLVLSISQSVYIIGLGQNEHNLKLLNCSDLHKGSKISQGSKASAW